MDNGRMATTQKPRDIDDYISQFPAAVRAVLEKVRVTIRHAAPDAKETISTSCQPSSNTESWSISPPGRST
jgi:uncharacterized protein YdhG (YjbR/CyaY superfamily)